MSLPFSQQREGKERWQNQAMVLKTPDRKTEGIMSTYTSCTKTSHIDKPLLMEAEV